MNDTLTPENRPACILLGSVLGDEDGSGMTHEDDSRVEFFVAFLHIVSVKLLGFLPVDSKEVGAWVVDPRLVEESIGGTVDTAMG